MTSVAFLSVNLGLCFWS